MRRAGALLAVLLLAVAGRAQDATDPLDDLRSDDPGRREAGRAALVADTEGTLLADALRMPVPLAREAAAKVVAGHPERAVPAIRAALRDLVRDRGVGLVVRRAAARAIGAIGDTAGGLVIRTALKDLPQEGSLALAALGEAGALPALRDLRSDLGEATPPETHFALAMLGDADAEGDLVAHLESTDAERARTALHLLRRLTGADHGASATRWREEIRVRSIAAQLGARDWDESERALAALRERGAAATDDLLRILDREAFGSEARARAALALGLIGAKTAAPRLLEASGRGRDPYVRVYALEALGRLAWAPAAPAIARMLVHDEDPDVPQSFFDGSGNYHAVQSAGLRALLAMGCDGAFWGVVDQMTAGEAEVLPVALVGQYRVRIYHEALAMLRDYGGPGAADGFGFLPDANDEARRVAGRRALAWWRAGPDDLTVESRADWSDPVFVSRVQQEIEILGAYKFLEMDRSRRALILMGGPAVPHLLATLARDPASDPTGQSRAGVAGVLASLGCREAVEPLLAAWNAATLPPVRARLLVALARLGPEGGVPVAAPLLADPNPALRAAAAEALDRAPTPGTAPALRQALAATDRDPTLRALLASALLGLRESDGVAPLLELLTADDVIHRRRAWRALDARLADLGPFDPASGTEFEAVRARWESQREAPHWR